MRHLPAINPGFLQTTDFVSLETSVAPIVESPALLHRVPDARIYRLGSPFPHESRQNLFRLLLVTANTFTATTDATGAVTVTMPATARITASPDLPGVASVRVATRAAADWSLRPAANVTVNYAVQTVTITGLPATTSHTITVYGFIGDPYARVTIAIQRAGGGPRGASIELAQTALADLHEASQVRGDQVPRLGTTMLALPADEIRVLLRSEVRHVPPTTLTPGGIRIGFDLERAQFHRMTGHLAALHSWVHQAGIPASADDLLYHLRAVQDGNMDAALGEGWDRLPLIPGLAVE